ncbi:isopenicillin N synthase family dioxygenase [Pseudorhodoplanes sinuspersici]|uniref:2-oxoglutarate-dependent ethylene/succinate-forming enzyme n=1 Tax=Pseudorhodoplanes sinuspersici TaxID=1235591 RepID=A0A1W7A0Q9_9HYPH|nr:2-oxoglutarate and iron-dependent oxygenase domain-containing protein [Pseudorhodoplanes sinuspersici]ARQ02615.1 oxidoreductase [Pseudorhodoplanes sinuspersici]RKE74477.1 isopenicillin N synthase-like dioxygenase [Pseudorhodoplanes sinuspersici]
MTATLEAARVSTAALPVIDISDLFSANFADRKAVGAELRAACLDKGFFYITNHGVPEDLIADVFAEAATFFALPAEQKAEVDKAKSKANRGYEPLQGQTLEPGTPPDLKEGYYIGPEHGPDDPRVVAGMFNHGPNQWPSQRPRFRPVMEAYRDIMFDLSATMMRGMALSLDLPENFFDGYTSDVMATVRLLHYPPQPAHGNPAQKGAGAHTDFGGLTLLRQGDIGGLQVWDQGSGSWIHADPLPGTYVVNLGDMISRWTNDRYRSTLHRVVNMSGKERYSIPFFYTGNYAYTVECIPTCLAPGEQPKYPPVTVEQHMRNMYQRTYK